MNMSSKLILTLGVCSALVGCSANSPAPVSNLQRDYSSVERGSYHGRYYQVKRGDTLYFIAYITGNNVNDLIRYNRLQAPYIIHPGQTLQLVPSAAATNSSSSTVANKPRQAQSSVPVVTSVSSTPKAPITPVVRSVPTQNSVREITLSPPPPRTPSQSTISPSTVAKEPVKSVEQSQPKEYVEHSRKQNVNRTVSASTSSNEMISKWLWPTKGKVISNFSAGDQGNRGIDISGQKGQAITATADGVVVYSGNALRGYGNLVIVKHNDNYLSAYAHNDRLLVHEGQSVKAGQKIATMGSSGASSVRLHFEIRYQGKSVNPRHYLP